jgi:hypothetical protein
MGFSEFINGMSAADVARMKAWELEQALQQEHLLHEDHLKILRPGGDCLPPHGERFELWKLHRGASKESTPQGGGPWDWWMGKFPESWRVFGPPILWEEANLDFLASALGELPMGIIYMPAEGRFYFRDYAHAETYRPTGREKVVALAKKLVNESVEGAPKSIKELARPIFHSAGGWVERAESLLAVEGHFFTGKGGYRRWIDGRFVEPLEKPSVELFTERRIQPLKGKILSAPDAYRLYAEFCMENGLPAVKKTHFRDQFAREVKKRWKLGVRNDLKVDGRSFQGWRELAPI